MPLCVLHVDEDWLLLFPSELFTLLLVSLYSLPVVDEGLDHVHVYATLDITRWGDSRMVSQRLSGNECLINQSLRSL